MDFNAAMSARHSCAEGLRTRLPPSLPLLRHRLKQHESGQRTSLSTVRSAQSDSSSAEGTAKAGATTSPFAGKNISLLLAARKNQAASKPAPPEQAQNSAASSTASPPAQPVSPSSPEPPKTSSLSPTIASLLKESSAPKSTAPAAAKPVSPFASGSKVSVNAVPASAAKPVVSFGRKSVIDALRSDVNTKGMTSVKVGQPGAPANIFDDPIRTKEQIEAEKFRFTVSKEQILLVLSFFGSSLIMLATAYVVWKLGAIHYDEL